ncbi:hypothetical protein [Paraburkholderia sediminicola]|uniref:hypothetical protein n=1 Tax=Paraburkholderia sediminicola TaxID=458836 RepID=UPI0038B9512B
MMTTERERSRASATSHANQVRAFINEIRDGDLVVTLDANLLMIGLVNGSAVIDPAPVAITRRSGRQHQMSFHLRRAVEWGPALKRNDVPFALEMTLLAHQTVFNLDAHWDTVYHLLYPYFRYQDHLYLSTNIEQTAALDNYSIAQIFSLLSGIEAVGKSLGEATFLSDETYLSMVETWIENGELTLTSKAEFMSPGTIWSRMKANPKGMGWAVLIYAMLFGAKTPLIETDGMIDKEMREKVAQIVIEMAQQHHLDKTKVKLGVSVPEHNTKALEKAVPHPDE